MAEAVKGIAPGFLLLPAREYSWELIRKVEIRVPNEGSIQELVDNSMASKDVKFTGDDDFAINDDNLVLLWELVKVLFAAAKYPDLNDNECLNVVAMGFEGNEVVLYGEVIRNL